MTKLDCTMIMGAQSPFTPARAARQGSVVTVPPTALPIDVPAAKRQLRIAADDDSDDLFIAELCAEVTASVESELGWPIMRQTRATHLSGFGRSDAAIWLGGGHNLTVDSIAYVDEVGGTQIMSAAQYHLDRISEPARVCPATGGWPVTAQRPGAVIITWTAGWQDPADVPGDLIRAIKLLIGHAEQNREAVTMGKNSFALTRAVDALLAPYRMQMVG